MARAKFRGANKRALWTLAGHASRVPEAGEDLEMKMGENWRRTGTVLAAVQLDDGRLLVQVVMNNDMEPTACSACVMMQTRSALSRCRIHWKIDAVSPGVDIHPLLWERVG